MELHRLDVALALAAREMDVVDSTEDVVRIAVERCLELVPGCEYAGITLRRRRGRLESVCPSHPVVARCDDLQRELGEGPCLDAISDETIVVSRDVADDPRWPAWGPRVTRQEGIRGMLGVRLFSGAGVHGALNLYAREAGAFTPESLDHAVVLATHVAVALRNATSSEHFQAAIDSRTVIGQGQGILMERFSLDPSQAFAVLNRVSQNGNIRLVEVARHLVDRRSLPAEPDSLSK